MPEEDLRKVRLDKLNVIEEKEGLKYPYSYPRTHCLADALNLKEGTKDIYLAGRMMTYRDMGKLSFATLRDHSGSMQIAVQVDILGKDLFKFFHKNADIGDIIGVSGDIFKTHKGELTLLVKEYSILCKALSPMPEKWHGIADKEVRYRKRYLDLIFNVDVVETFKKRTRILKSIREFLDNRGALEVENPVLETIYGGAFAKPFSTHLNAMDLPMFLRISLELPLKKLIVGGFDWVYEIGKVFRNEGVDKNHNPEFTLMEWYKAYSDYRDTMKITEEMFEFVAKKILGTTEIEYQGTKISLKAPFRRLKMEDAIHEIGGIDVRKMDLDELLKKAKELKLDLPKTHRTRGWVINELFEATCEEKLIQPVFITNHPVETTPFCKVDREDPETLERFELYMNGWEIANSYSELNDPVLQRKYLEDQVANINAGDEEANPMNEDYIEALEYGLPPNSGIGFGIDRIVMLLTNSASIRDVIFAPLMRPEFVNHKTNLPTGDEKKVKKIESGISLDEAKLLVKKECDFSLARHCFTVSASMKALCKHFKDEENIEAWEIAGLLHDIDWNKTINSPEKHCGEETIKLLKDNKVSDPMIEIIRSHYDKTEVERDNLIKKSLAACDELTGFTVACALVRPNKMSDIEAKSVVKKIKDKAFAAQVSREDMRLCEEYLSIPLSEFIGILIPEIQAISKEWELI